jgi:hypothetical protein
VIEQSQSANRIGQFEYRATSSIAHWVAPTSLDWKNADHSTVGTVVFEAHSAGNFRKDGVILAEARIPSRTEPTPTLPDDDSSTSDDVAVVCLDAEPLRIRVAAVSGAALSFFVCHD